MSLVNLAHVCSHLQNASLARLGLTSIPYTKLHLSLSLLLHKQGFLSQVKVAGQSPPASCFPGGLRNNDVVSAQPHLDRHPRSAASALTETVVNGKKEQDLVADGFGEEEIAFALRHRELNREQLMKDGWDTTAIDFLVANGGKSRDSIREEGSELDDQAIAMIEKYDLPTITRHLAKGILQTRSSLDPSDIETRLALPYETLVRNQVVLQQLRAFLRKQGFDENELRYFAKERKYVTARHLANDGIEIDVMGLTIPNQPFTPIPQEYRDPWQLEEEGVITQANRASRRLWLGLKYWEGKPVLSKARMLSKPTKRIWLDHRDIGKVVRGNQSGEIKPMTQIGEIIAVSTDRGIMEARECVERKIGGMMLCRMW